VPSGKPARRFVGKIYRIVVSGFWESYLDARFPVRGQCVPVATASSGGEFNSEFKIPVGDLVLYLGSREKGFSAVLWGEQVCKLQSVWLSTEHIKQ